MISVYGVGVKDLPYDQYVGLWFNLPRVSLRKTAEMTWAILFSNPNVSLRPDFFDSMALTPEEGENQHFVVSSDREFSRIIHGHQRS